VVASLRYDYTNVFHGVFTPRLNALFRHTPEWASRAAIGTGYRFPTSFFEVDHGILATTRVVRQVQNPEKSKNASYALSYASDRLSGVASLHWTQVSNPALLDADACLTPQNEIVPSADPTCATSVTVFGSGKTDFTVAGADAIVTYRLTPPLDVSVGGEVYTYDFVPEQLVPGGQFLSPLLFARPNARAYFRADYEAHGWLLFARATWTSTQNLARFYDYTNNQRYNLDGTPKLDTSPPFWTADVRAQYNWKNLSFIAGINNIFDYRQVDREDFLWVDAAGSPDVTQMWGPNLGRSWYIGLKADLW
jgi:outer membrane receptor for ferrienterochelin and colicins